MLVPDMPVPGASAAALYAQARCEAAERCSCTIEAFASEEECRGSMETRFMAWQQQMEPAIFSGDCFDSLLEFFDTLQCSTSQVLSLEDSRVGCELYWGERAAGEACVGGGGSSAHGHNCGEGLVCGSTLDGRVCMTSEDAAVRAAADEICAVDGNVRLGCVSGLFCDPQTERCTPRVDEGELCPNAASCASGLWCDNLADPAAPTCQPRRPAGADCISATSCAPQGCELGACATAQCISGSCDATTPRACFLADL